jgi:hypothetical protein
MKKAKIRSLHCGHSYVPSTLMIVLTIPPGVAARGGNGRQRPRLSARPRRKVIRPVPAQERLDNGLDYRFYAQTEGTYCRKPCFHFISSLSSLLFLE